MNIAALNTDRQSTVPRVLSELAHRLGTEVRNWRLDIPAQYGRGYCAGFVFNEFIRLMIFDYELGEDLVINNPDVDVAGRMILFKFQNVIFGKDRALLASALPSVLIVTSRVNANLAIPVQRNRAMINIEIDAAYLKSLFFASEKSPVLQSLLENKQPLLFEELVFPQLQLLVEELTSESLDENFSLFFRRIKAEELVCRLLMVLEKRDEKHLYPLNSQDIQTIYRIKEQMLERLDIPPMIGDLARSASMSPTKIKRLFRQIFGDSIFSYYQAFRVNEAARLLKSGQMSVSEVGYRLGFTNLSHFSRVFEKQMGVKPKKFSASKSV